MANLTSARMPGQTELSAEEEGMQELVAALRTPTWKPRPVQKYAVDPNNEESHAAMK
jgi:hypothetical protein